MSAATILRTDAAAERAEALATYRAILQGDGEIDRDELRRVASVLGATAADVQSDESALTEHARVSSEMPSDASVQAAERAQQQTPVEVAQEIRKRIAASLDHIPLVQLWDVWDAVMRYSGILDIDGECMLRQRIAEAQGNLTIARNTRRQAEERLRSLESAHPRVFARDGCS